MNQLETLLQTSAALHRHLCPRQVLGVRIGMLAAQLLGLNLPQTDKRLLTIVETDGCAADGVAVATGCWVGRRTLRIADYGKVAATCIDTHTERAIRIAPRIDIRTIAPTYVPETTQRWETQLLGYQRMPDEHLLTWQEVTLTTPLRDIISRPGARAICSTCGEEIINEREIINDDGIRCRACAGLAYYRTHLTTAANTQETTTYAYHPLLV